MRVLVLGAGVIGSVYTGRLLEGGHEVVMLARGQRLLDLRESGLILQRADTDEQLQQSVLAVSDLEHQAEFDLVLVAVRSEQLTEVLPIMTGMNDASDVLFFGNYPERRDELVAALGSRVLLGFPAVGGTREGPTVRYVPISQQRTMLGEPNGQPTARVQRIADTLRTVGFPTSISTRMDAWLLGHTAFIAPIGCALTLAAVDARRLANDRDLLRLMVRATRQAFRALDAQGSVEIPTNLRTLYLRLPMMFAVTYWNRVLGSPRGELWFAAHTRAAPQEMKELAHSLGSAVDRTGRPAPQLRQLIETAYPTGL